MRELNLPLPEKPEGIAQAQLEIHLFGNPEVLWRGQPISIKRRTTRLLLFFLAAQDMPVNRKYLANLFWENLPEAAARQNLRQALYRLRTSFPYPHILIERDDIVALDSNQVCVDVIQFSSDYSSVFAQVHQILNSKILTEEIVQKLRLMARQWRGARFLGETSLPNNPELEHWVEAIDARLAPMRRWVFERLSDHAAASGRLDEAMGYIQQALVENVWDESLHGRMLDFLLRLNQPRKAQEYYRKLVHNLAKSGLPLADQFRQKYEPLINPPTSAVKNPRINWNIYGGNELPFVGRQKELDVLAQQYLTGGTVLIFGESGMGKTSLLASFVERIPHARIILAQARPGESNLPYQPIADALRVTIQPTEWLRLSAVWANQLIQLFPELNSIRSDLRAAMHVNPDQARAQIQEALRQLLLLLNPSQRLVLILDDAQWSDEVTLAALEYLIIRPPFDQRALLVLAARLEERNPSLQRMLVNLEKVEAVKTLELPSLNTEDIGKLVKSYLLSRVSFSFIERLATDSGGNPLYIGEMLRSSSINQDDTATLEKFPLSPNLTRLIRNRLDRLSPASQDVLQLAAVLGNEIPLVILSAASQVLPQALADGLDELEAHHLIRYSRHGNQAYIQFIHDKFREVQLQLISPARLTWLHDRAARALEENAGSKMDEQAAMIAQHYEQAGNFLKSFHYWRRAGEHSLQLFSAKDAIAAFTRADEAITFCSTQIEDIEISSLFRIWGDLVQVMNDTSAIQAIGERMIALGKQRNSQLLLGRGYYWLGMAAFSINNLLSALEQTNTALHFLDSLNNSKAIFDVHWLVGIIQYLGGNITASITSLQKALELLGDIKTTETETLQYIAGVLYELGFVQVLSGWPKPAFQKAHQAMEIYQKAAIRRPFLGSATPVMAASLTGLAAYFLGRFEFGRDSCLAMINTAMQIETWRGVGYLHIYIALQEIAMGHLDQALVHAQQGIHYGEAYGRKEVYSFARRVLADGLFWLQDYIGARELYLQALAENTDMFLTLDYRLHLGICDFLLGSPDEALNSILEIYQHSQESGLGLIKHYAAIGLMTVYAGSENWQACGEIAEQIAIETEERSLLGMQAYAEYFLGLYDIHCNQLDAALARLQGVAQAALEMKFIWIELKAQQAFAQVLARLNQDNQPAIERISVLLDYLAKHTQESPYHQAFHLFHDNLVHNLNIVPH